MLFVNTDDSPFLFCRDKFRHKKIISDEMILWFDFQSSLGKGHRNMLEEIFF